MASSCPNCGKKLHWYDVKAECSNCGVSIPNFNWEERLEADNELAERKFASFYRALNRIAYSICGTKLRIARIVLSVLPAIGFILPWATSVLSAVGSAVCFTLGIKAAPNEIGINFGSFPVYNATGSVAWGFYVALALLLVAVGINAAVAKAPSKTDDELESERLARKAAKEQKEYEAALKKDIEREEAEKKEKEEQARIVAEAKAKLAKSENKKK